MGLQYPYLFLLATCGVILPLSSSWAAFPVKITSATGVCPSEDQRADLRQQITDEIFFALNPGLIESYPATSCGAVPSGKPSGFYWIQPATGQPAVQVYCDFNRRCGCDGPSTWTRIALLDTSNTSQVCPDDWFTYTSPRACGRGQASAGGCSSLVYPTHGQLYSRVCGRVLGYQNHFTTAFSNLFRPCSDSIDENYLSGVSLTHSSPGSRQHIWSFASALSEQSSGPFFFTSVDNVCDCNINNGNNWPYNLSATFVGNDYFCDSGHEGNPPNAIFSGDPLWDGAGCGHLSTCCQFNNPPWFCKTLPQPTTDDLEVRGCKPPNPPGSGATSDVPVNLIELYIQ